MTYTITGTLVYATQANRDAALTRINNALIGVAYTNKASLAFSAGVTTPNATTINISVECPEGDDGEAASTKSRAIYDAATSTTRNTRGYLSVNLK